MTIQQLNYVIALDDFRHFVKASEHCLVTQPTLTMQVQKLEKEIGLNLFDRSKKPLEPTPSGKVFIEKARAILHEIDHLKNFVNNEIENVEGTFTLGVIPTIAPYLLPLFLPEFIHKYPKTVLEIKELQTHQIIEQLKIGQLDIGILATPLEVSGIKEVPLYHEPFILYAPIESTLLSNDKINEADLIDKSLLLLEEGHCFRNQTLNICQQNESQQQSFAYNSGSIETLKALVEKGMGITLVPELSTKIDSPYSKRFESPEPSREISIVVKNTFSKEKVLDILHESIIETVPEHFRTHHVYKRIPWI